MAETRINTECFLPVREGVSQRSSLPPNPDVFPPCTGGCIAWKELESDIQTVSSLYGRVYRFVKVKKQNVLSFLPVREGVSAALNA